MTQHNKLLQQLAKSFRSSHNGSSVSTYDFGAAFSQASLLQGDLLGLFPFVMCCWRLMSDHPLVTESTKLARACFSQPAKLHRRLVSHSRGLLVEARTCNTQ